MVVCKYFLQNRCRYGNNCRFEHDQGGGVQRQLRFDNGGGGGGRDSNRYKWTAQNNNNNSGGEAQNNPEEIVSGLRSNLETWEQSKMWPFSCMALEKDHPCMPEFNDLSADELRWEAYQAIKGGGNLMAYTEKVKQLTEEYRNKRQLLKHPTSDIKNQLIQFINNYRQNKNTDAKSSFVKPSAFGSPGSSSSGAFGNMSSTATAASSGFGETVAPTQSDEIIEGCYDVNLSLSDVIDPCQGASNSTAYSMSEEERPIKRPRKSSIQEKTTTGDVFSIQKKVLEAQLRREKHEKEVSTARENREQELHNLRKTKLNLQIDLLRKLNSNHTNIPSDMFLF